MDNVFKAMGVRLMQRVDAAIAATLPRQAFVTRSEGSHVFVRFAHEGADSPESQFLSTVAGVPPGTMGWVFAIGGKKGLFVAADTKSPLGKHWYDRGDGIQVGSVDPSAIDPVASSFVAIGSGPTITGSESVAIGIGASSGYRGVSIGSEAMNAGGHSIAIGRATVSTGSSASIAIGHFTEATDDFSIAQGYTAKASSSHAIAIGFLAKGTAGYAVAIGPGADAGYSGSQYGEVAIGRSASAKYARGVAIGFQAATTRHYEGVIKADTLKVEPSSARIHSKLGLKSTSGDWWYIWVDGNGDIQVNQAW